MMSGKLDRTVTLVTATLTKDAFGAEVATPSDLATVAASKDALRASDATKGQLHNTVFDGKFVIRWRGDVTNKMKLRHDGITYDIVDVEEIGRKRGLALLVRAG
jgi:SPP1 family predicted phage head-tail adaptor